MKLLAVIPAYNEEQTIAGVLARTRPLADAVVVIDDGSADRTAEIARGAGAAAVSHVMNRGLGAALGTGFAYARRVSAEAVITLDADGQHDPKEIPRFFEELQKGADMVIGSRMIGSGNPPPSLQQGRRAGLPERLADLSSGRAGMPWYRRAANTLGNLVTLVLFGAWVTDSQSGYRAFSAKALSKIEIRTNRMEVSSELVAEAKRHGLKIREIPIQAIYTDYSLSKGQGFLVGLKTLLKLVVRRLSH